MQDSLEDYIRLINNTKPTHIKLNAQEQNVSWERKQQCEDYAFKIIEFMIEGKLQPQVFIKSLNFIHPEHYQDIVEERAVTRICGYPVCGKRLPQMPKKQFHISTKQNKIYDITDRKLFCCNYCYQASEFVKKQIESSPLWLRRPEDFQRFVLLDQKEILRPGVEIDHGLAKLPTGETNFTSVNTFTEACLDEAEEMELKRLMREKEEEEEIAFGKKKPKSILKKRILSSVKEEKIEVFENEGSEENKPKSIFKKNSLNNKNGKHTIRKSFDEMQEESLGNVEIIVSEGKRVKIEDIVEGNNFNEDCERTKEIKVGYCGLAIKKRKLEDEKVKNKVKDYEKLEDQKMENTVKDCQPLEDVKIENKAKDFEKLEDKRIENKVIDSEIIEDEKNGNTDKNEDEEIEKQAKECKKFEDEKKINSLKKTGDEIDNLVEEKSVQLYTDLKETGEINEGASPEKVDEEKIETQNQQKFEILDEKNKPEIAKCYDNLGKSERNIGVSKEENDSVKSERNIEILKKESYSTKLSRNIKILNEEIDSTKSGTNIEILKKENVSTKLEKNITKVKEEKDLKKSQRKEAPVEIVKLKEEKEEIFEIRKKITVVADYAVPSTSGKKSVRFKIEPQEKSKCMAIGMEDSGDSENSIKFSMNKDGEEEIVGKVRKSGGGFKNKPSEEEIADLTESMSKICKYMGIEMPQQKQATQKISQEEKVEINEERMRRVIEKINAKEANRGRKIQLIETRNNPDENQQKIKQSLLNSQPLMPDFRENEKDLLKSDYLKRIDDSQTSKENKQHLIKLETLQRIFDDSPTLKDNLKESKKNFMKSKCSQRISDDSQTLNDDLEQNKQNLIKSESLQRTSNDSSCLKGDLKENKNDVTKLESLKRISDHGMNKVEHLNPESQQRNSVKNKKSPKRNSAEHLVASNILKAESSRKNPVSGDIKEGVLMPEFSETNSWDDEFKKKVNSDESAVGLPHKNLPKYAVKIVQKIKPPQKDDTNLKQVIEKVKNLGLNKPTGDQEEDKLKTILEKIKRKETATKKVPILINTEINPEVEIPKQKKVMLKPKEKEIQSAALNKIRVCLLQWLTLETYTFIHGEAKIKSILNEAALGGYFEKLKIAELETVKQVRYMNICKKLQLRELAEEKFDGVLLDTFKQRKPLPDYGRLKEEGKDMDLKVKAFFTGRVYERDDPNFKEGKRKDEERDGGESPAVLPSVDAGSQNAVRRRIFFNAVNKYVQIHLKELELEGSVLIDIQDMVKTFKLEADNIVFKPQMWNIIGFVLILMISPKCDLVRSKLMNINADTYRDLLFSKFEDWKDFLQKVLHIVERVDVYVENYIVSE